MATLRTASKSFLVLLLLASAVVPTVQAGRVDEETNRPSMESKGSDDFQFAHRTFSVGSRLFYAGPQWFLDALPGSKRANTRYVLDRAGDRVESDTVYNGYVGTLRDVFDVALFNNISTFASPSGSKISTPTVANLAPVYYFNGAFDALWTHDLTWAPEVAGYPTNSGDVAINPLQVSSSVIQNHEPGVNVGIIDHNPETPFNSGNTVNWTITTNNLIVMNNGASPAQINNTQTFGNSSLTINGPAGLSLTSNLNITNANATGLITISAPIVGNGGITVGGVGTTLLTGDNTFYGATIVNSGTLNAGGAHSLGGGGSGLTAGLGTASVTVNAGGTLLFSGVTTDRIKNDAPIFLNGGTLNTGGLSEGTPAAPGMGALTLTLTNTIDLGTGNSIISFADSSGQTWTGATLRIVNWTGTVGLGDGTDQVYFGTTSGGLNQGQLDQISFYSDAAGLNFLGTGMILSDGEVVPVPEPATWAGAALALGAIAWKQLRKRSRTRASLLAS